MLRQFFYHFHYYCQQCCVVVTRIILIEITADSRLIIVNTIVLLFFIESIVSEIFNLLYGSNEFFFFCHAKKLNGPQFEYGYSKDKSP